MTINQILTIVRAQPTLTVQFMINTSCEVLIVHPTIKYRLYPFVYIIHEERVAVQVFPIVMKSFITNADQLILERASKTSTHYWIHVSCKSEPSQNRHQVKFITKA